MAVLCSLLIFLRPIIISFAVVMSYVPLIKRVKPHCLRSYMRLHAMTFPDISILITRQETAVCGNSHVRLREILNLKDKSVIRYLMCKVRLLLLHFSIKSAFPQMLNFIKDMIKL